MKSFVLALLAVAAFAFPTYAAEGLTAEKLPVAKSEVKTAAPAFQLTEAEQTILNNVNTARAARGLLPLQADPILTQRARNHAAWMATTGRKQHSRGAWENIAWSHRTPLQAFRTWMASTGHYANMMSRRATHIGIGVSGGDYVQQFAAHPAATVGQPVSVQPTAQAQCANGQCNVASTATYGGRARDFLSKFRVLKNRRG